MHADSTLNLPSIRSKIALLVLACALPTAVGFGLLIDHFYQREQRQITAAAVQTAQALVAAVDRDLEHGTTAALALAASPSLASGDWAAFDAQARRLLRPEFPGASFVLSEAGGRQLVNTATAPGPAPAANARPARPPLFIGQPVLSDLHGGTPFGTPSGTPVVTLAVPLWRDARLAYTLTLAFQPARLGRLLTEQHLPPDLVVALLDASGVIVARTHDAGKYVGLKSAPLLLQGSRLAAQGVIRTGTLEGTPVYASFSRSARSGWTVAIGIPEASLLGALLSSVSLITAAVAALLCAGFALAWFIGGRISRTVKALTLPGHGLAAGAPRQIAGAGFFREAQEVALALADMEVEMLRHRHHLETLVAERTAELEKSKVLLETVYATAPVGLCLIDAELRFTMVNDYLANFNGCSVDEHVGHRMSELLPALAAKVEPSLRQVFSSGKPIVGSELTHSLPSAPHLERHCIVSYYPVFDPQRRVVGVNGVLLDITGRKRADVALRQSQQLLTSIVENMPAMVFIKRASDLRFDMVNRHGEQILGYSRQQMLDRNDADLFPAADAQRFMQAERLVLAAPTMVETQQEPITTASGAIRYLTTRRVALRNEAGVATHLLGFALDVTERKEAEEALRATSARLEDSERFIRGITDHLPGMVAYWDADLHCRFGNKQFFDSFDLRQDQVIGITLAELFQPAMLASIMPHVQGVLAGRAQSFERQLVKQTGETRYAWANYIPDFDPAGQVCGYFVLISDVSELKRAELRLHELNLELVRARDKAEAASRAKSDFVANMSHEIRTPMNAILCLARLLEESALAPRERSYLARIKLATGALLGVLNDVLDFSKIEAGRLQLEHAPFKLEHILTSSAVLVAGNAWTKGVEPIFAVAPDVPPELVGDALRLQQVLFNLVGNAIKFTERGEVLLAVRTLGRNGRLITLEFSVRDSGIGIAPQAQAQLFDAFSQADTSTSRKYGGTGLGLAICRRLVGLMGGSIGVQSELGQGSEFRFTCTFELPADSLPLACPPEHAGLSLLIVDANASVRRVLQNACAAFGWQAATAANAGAALELLRGPRPFDLCLLDRNIDAPALLAGAGPRLPMPPVILMVADPGAADLERAVAGLELAAILSKPATPSALLAAVCSARGGAGQAPPSAAPPLAGLLAGRRLLLVEDNAMNQDVARHILQLAGAQVDVAGNGQIAVDLLRAGAPYDAVLMDIQMPVLNGYQATRAIRAMGLADLTIIAMTANAMQEDRRQAFDAGMNAHIAKPLDVDALIATLARLSGAGRTARPAALAGIELDATLRRFGGQHEVFFALLKRFEHAHGDTVPETRRLLDAGRRAAACQALHRLRGVAANLGAGRIAALSLQAESAIAGAEAVADTGVPSLLLDELAQAMAVVIGTARALPVPRPAAPAGAAPLAQALAELLDLVQNHDLLALSRFQLLRADLERCGSMLALAEAIETLDFSVAETLLQALSARKDLA